MHVCDLQKLVRIQLAFNTFPEMFSCLFLPTPELSSKRNQCLLWTSGCLTQMPILYGHPATLLKDYIFQAILQPGEKIQGGTEIERGSFANQYQTDPSHL
ncbi:PREDICTED: LOW QUALITY PROTEIN: putative uncharacterized protein C3orf79 homolog [Cercocebus atys]|uniref:LOW QUALITY PROTEIN: putative uncharacterized protein C3orf79 homolog n=1 Tax=Cercocebus atys TaxID=9531 RepID=UPI0005F46014|nr:PREDICTED: LOW QUALITY PROTEIN: putative uncharacterized protein C3orf79 homolog [Cercocebus atys]